MSKTQFQIMALGELKECALNPRQHYDQKKIEELAQSIKSVGVLQPIVVRPNGPGHEIIAGTRRYRAASFAYLPEVPVIVRELTDAEALEIMVIENNQREDVNALEEAEGYKRLIEHQYNLESLAAKIGRLLKRHGAGIVYGIDPKEELPGLESERRRIDREGIFSSDVVLVPLEDGDRTEALVKAGKRVIAIDLNPLSRTAQKATITIVDNVVRALPALQEEVEGLRSKGRGKLERMVEAYDRDENLETTLEHICRRLRKNFK